MNGPDGRGDADDLGDVDDDYADELVRPFLATGIQASSPSMADDEGDVRPYFLTGGRTTADERVQFESIVVQSGPLRATDGPEHAAIFQLAQAPLSVAELSTKVRLPIGVVRVLVADLVDRGSLLLSQTARHPASDADLIRKVISGVKALRYATAGDHAQ